MARSRDNTHPVGDGAKSPMSQEAAHVVGRFIGPYIQPDQTVGRMAKFTAKKVLVLGEKRDLPLPVQ